MIFFIELKKLSKLFFLKFGKFYIRSLYLICCEWLGLEERVFIILGNFFSVKF